MGLGWSLEIRGVAAGPIAGKPAPTGFSVYTEFVYDINHCGSGLARDGVRSGAAGLKGQRGTDSSDHDSNPETACPYPSAPSQYNPAPDT
ncbi:hypothetical protein EI534_13010 [Pseudomonas frederiksbergensis]|nr:hypothetical protein [Pseudomonas frederiksbergensis]